MSIHEYYITMTPVGYFAAVVAIGFFAGLFLGWLLWWWGARQYDQTRLALREAKSEAEELALENKRLEESVQSREARSGHPIRIHGHHPELVAGAIEGHSVVERATAALPSGGEISGDSINDSRHAVSANGSSDPRKVECKTDWNSFPALSPKAASILNAMEIESPDHLKKLSPAGKLQLDSTFKAKGVDWNWSVVETLETSPEVVEENAVAENTVADNSAVEREIDHSSRQKQNVIRADASHMGQLPPAWRSVDGVNRKSAAVLEAMEIGSVEQLIQLPAEARIDLEKHMALKGIQWDWGKIDSHANLNETAAQTAAQTAATTSAPASSTTESAGDRCKNSNAWKPMTSKNANMSGPSSFTNGSVSALGVTASESESSGHRPRFATEIPRFKDDLTLLDGIDAAQAEELHRMGIHNFDQLHDLSPEDQGRLSAWFSTKGWSLQFDQWRIASEGNTLNPTMEQIQNKAFEVFQYREQHGLHGGENTDWDQAEWELRGNPIFGYGVPDHVDDFEANHANLTPEARDELYRMGLYNFDQVAQLAPESRRMLAGWFAGPRFKVDVTSAFGWLSSMSTVPQDLDYGLVHWNPPERIDDLSEIEGIGPVTERQLNRIGIFQFDQIAQWSEANVHAISEALGLDAPDNVVRWIKKAKLLSHQDVA